MKSGTPQRCAVPWKKLVLLGICTTGVVACRPSRTDGGNTPEAKPHFVEENLLDQLNPVHQPPPPRATAFVAPPPWNPATIFPVPVRTWLPPAETPEKQGALPAEQRIAAAPPHSLREVPMLAPIASPPGSLLLPAAPLAHATSPDPARINVRITTNLAAQMRGQPPHWDRPQFTTDPTAQLSRDLALAPPSGLRETPPPFLRINIPDPFEQIAIAELRNPPPENDPPVTPFIRPAIILPESAVAPAGK